MSAAARFKRWGQERGGGGEGKGSQQRVQQQLQLEEGSWGALAGPTIRVRIMTRMIALMGTNDSLHGHPRMVLRD